MKDTGAPGDGAKIAKVSFFLTVAGVIAWIAVVSVFILGGNP